MYGSRHNSINLPGGVTELCGPSSKRVRISFSSGDSSVYRVSTDVSQLTAGLGYVIGANSSGKEFSVEDHGSCVQDAWFAVPNVVNIKIGWLEVYR